MKKLSFELKVFITLIVLCIAGIVFSTIAIDKQIDKYIEELKTEIKIVNNGNDEINIDRENNTIVITVNPIEEEETEEVTEIRGMVISNNGLNIRQNPSVESERIGVLEYGSEVIILEDCGDWYRIDNGYIFKEYVIRI